MYTVEVIFPVLSDQELDHDKVSHTINGLLGAWRMNGQVHGREFSIADREEDFFCCLMCPEPHALDAQFDNKYVRKYRETLSNAGLSQPIIRLIAADVDSLPLCSCESSSSYILYTNYLSLESPLRCGDCFDSIPLYRLPKTYDDEYYNIIVWQSDYQACDALFMNSGVLERATHRELSTFSSKLFQQGHALARQIEDLTGRAVYSRLMKHYGRSLAEERRRRCPSCGGAWLLDEPWHRFDFRCDLCRLVSNIAWAVRPND